jgi:2-polyprenyl-3-methyl-5-hydroxy-6-metoxy-1,4-benzoquinol methylase
MPTPDPVFWDRLAERYAAKPVDDPDAFERKIAVTRALIEPGDTVLNIGCGTGSLCLRLSDLGADLHGLDLSPEMIRIARSKLDAAGARGITFHVGAFDEGFRVFDDGSLDVVMAYSLLHLLPDRAAGLRRMRQLLKPGGHFVSSTVTLGNSWVPYRLLLAGMRLVGKAPFVAIVSTDTLKRELADAGFVDIQSPEVGAAGIITFLTARAPE